MSLEITGKVLKIEEEQQITSTFRKRTIVLETGEQYPQKIAFEFANDKIEKLDYCKVGDKVTIKFNVRGREWNGKYFVNLDGWYVKKSEPDGSNENPYTYPPTVDVEEEDLPF